MDTRKCGKQGDEEPRDGSNNRTKERGREEDGGTGGGGEGWGGGGEKQGRERQGRLHHNGWIEEKADEEEKEKKATGQWTPFISHLLPRSVAGPTCVL